MNSEFRWRLLWQAQTRAGHSSPLYPDQRRFSHTYIFSLFTAINHIVQLMILTHLRTHSEKCKLSHVKRDDVYNLNDYFFYFWEGSVGNPLISYLILPYNLFSSSPSPSSKTAKWWVPLVAPDPTEFSSLVLTWAKGNNVVVSLLHTGRHISR